MTSARPLPERVLWELRDGPFSHRALAGYAGADPVELVEVTEGLLTRGLIAPHQHPGERQPSAWTLTEAGRAAIGNPEPRCRRCYGGPQVEGSYYCAGCRRDRVAARVGAGARDPDAIRDSMRPGK